MIDSSKKQQQGFPEILTAGDFEPVKEKECLEGSNQKSLKEVLQLRLQQRRTREQLVDQGIMPPLKSPAAFHEQIKSLERARTENFLKHKIRSRPDRSELVRMHILEETFAEPSLQATQMKLKRARLADDLNEKIAQRPGPMELVEKNILPVDSSVKEAIIGVGKEDYPQTQGDFSFDEDSSDALSPDQPASQDSQGSAASPTEPKVSESPSPVTTSTPAQQFTSVSPAVPEFLKTPAPDQPLTRSPAPVLPTSTVSSAKPGPSLVKQNPDLKLLELKKDIRELADPLCTYQMRNHQEKGTFTLASQDKLYKKVPSLFELKVFLSEQATQFMIRVVCGNSTRIFSTTTPNTPRQNPSASVRKPGPLPSSLDDLKVSELKTELKLRGLPVSGTKPDLIERLKPYQEVNSSAVAAGGVLAVPASAIVASNPEVTVALPVTTLHNSVTSSGPSFKAELPPAGSSNLKQASGAFLLLIAFIFSEHGIVSERADILRYRLHMGLQLTAPRSRVTCSSVYFKWLTPFSSPFPPEDLSDGTHFEVNRNHLGQCSSALTTTPPPTYSSWQRPVGCAPEVRKQDPEALGMCKHSNSPFSVFSKFPNENLSHLRNNKSVKKTGLVLGLWFRIKVQTVLSMKCVSVCKYFITSFQISSPHDRMLHISRVPCSSDRTIQTPPQAGIQTQTQPQTAATTLSSGLAQTVPQKQEAFTPHVLSQPQQVRKVFTNSASNSVLPYERPPAPAVQQPFVNKTSTSVLQSRSAPLASLQNGPTASNKPSSPPPPQQCVVQHSLFGSPVPKTKDPPRYEEAIKQTRGAPSSLPEISSAHSQQMDDLFDILIKSGEISLPIKEEPSPISKMRPVTASITTMPVNTVVSRPPPQVQMAPPVSLEPLSSLSASLENQLEAFLDGTLPSANEIVPLQSSSEDREPFSLIEDLQNDLLSHSSVLDHSHSPMETSEAQFAASTPCLSLDLSDSNLDNMEWLDITMPNTSGLTPLSATAPSMFSTDFLDPQDLPLPWD
ncbi:mkl myocardin-like 2 isoform 2 [Lynx pardinus]|uniref:Mkl myocardin-like 2 isoform 2 n=1 Tax=Lynx pardinus TaxID=191816 RepID=A0A485NLP4_LYNPA|nr:mkl myocardin-like 2 isoform 2 [Lynx pardinus]